MPKGFDSTLRDRLPLPLARLYRRAFNDKTPAGRHDNAFYLLEAALKLAAAGQIGIYLTARETNRNESLEARTLRHLALPSIGHWVAFLRDVAKHNSALDEANHPFPALSTVAFELFEKRTDLTATRDFLRIAGLRIKTLEDFTASKVRILDVFERLAAYRNETIGHGARMVDAFYSLMAPLLLDAATELLRQPFLVGGAVLVYVGEVRNTPTGERNVELWDLTGSEAMRSTPTGGTDEFGTFAFCAGHLYLKKGRDFLDLHPLLVCDPTPPDADVTFLNRSRLGKRVDYLNYETGEPSTAPQLVEDHRRTLGEILGERVSDARLAELQAKSLSDHPEPDSEPAPTGARQFGDFLLLHKLGSGGMGTAYLAQQLSLGRLVAIKMLPPALSDDEIATARFRREVRALARADHPNVIRILQSGRTEGIYWFAMEYVEGSTLAEVSTQLAGSRSALSSQDLIRAVSSITDGKRQEIEDFKDVPELDQRDPVSLDHKPSFAQQSLGHHLADLFAQLCDGLQHLHERGVIHRDIKPDNVMLTRNEGRPVLMDLGLAHVAGDTSLTIQGKVLGALRYIAPEQLRQAVTMKRSNAPADIYALGATLYAIATGQPPYGDATDEQVTAQKLSGRGPRPPRFVDSGLSRDIDAIIQKATAFDSTDRYASVEEFARDLRRYVRGDPIDARPPGLGRLLMVAIKRHKAMATTIMVAALTLSSSTLGFLLRLEAKNDELEAQTAEAHARLEEANAIEEFVDGVFSAASPFAARSIDAESPNLGHGQMTIREVLDVGEPRITEAFSDRPLLRVRMLQRIASLRQALGYPERAAHYLSQAIEIADSIPEHLSVEERVELTFQLVSAYTDSGDSKGAVGMLEQLDDQTLDPANRARYLNFLGAVLLHQGRIGDATAALTECRRIVDSNNLELTHLYRNMATLAWQTRDLEAADRHLREWIAALTAAYGPHDFELLSAEAELAAIKRETGDNAGAEAILRRALAQALERGGNDHPHVGKIRLRLAQLLIERRQLDEAYECVEAVQSPGLAPWRWNCMAIIRKDQFEYADAHRLFTMALEAWRELHGDGHEFVRAVKANLGFCCCWTGDLDRAESLADEVLTAEPKSAFAHWLRGEVALKRAQWAKARTHLETAADLMARRDSQWVFLATSRARVLNTLGQFEEAEAIARAAVDHATQLGLQEHVIMGLSRFQLGWSVARTAEGKKQLEGSLALFERLDSSYALLPLKTLAIHHAEDAPALLRRAIEVAIDWEGASGVEALECRVLLARAVEADEALQNYDTVIELLRDEPDLSFRKANTLAIAALEKAQLLARTAGAKAALPAFEFALPVVHRRLRSVWPSSLGKYALALLRAGETEKATATYEQAREALRAAGNSRSLEVLDATWRKTQKD